jgi:hypothetical protein
MKHENGLACLKKLSWMQNIRKNAIVGNNIPTYTNNSFWKEKDHKYNKTRLERSQP